MDPDHKQGKIKSSEVNRRITVHYEVKMEESEGEYYG